MGSSAIKICVLVCLVGAVVGEITVDSRATLALKKRSEMVGYSLRWCDIFYQEDFPKNVDCSGKNDLVWDYFPSCCNGAYNCRNNAIWNIYLCAPGYVYDAASEGCVEFLEDSCPYVNGVPGDDMTTEEDIPTTTESQIIINCNTVVNGRIPHPTDCRKFVECIDRVPHVRDCLDEYVYYAPFAVCLPGKEEACKLWTLEDLEAAL
nr:uncharacterized protein LOC109410595 [Aedes albopictus]